MSFGQEVSVISNIEELAYREKPLTTVTISGRNTFGLDMFLKSPRINKENILNAVRDHSLAIDRNNLSAIKLNIESNEDGYLNEYNLTLTNSNKIIGHSKIHSRVKYRGDINSEGNGELLEFLLHSNFWNWLLQYYPPIQNDKFIISSFLKKHLLVKQKANSHINQNTIAGNYYDGPNLKYNIKRGASRSFVRCHKHDPFMHKYILFVNDGHIQRPINKIRDAEKIICDKNHLSIITTPSRANPIIEIDQYQYDGHLSTKYSFTLSIVEPDR